jgi:tyrosyl-tRNA synthetase
MEEVEEYDKLEGAQLREAKEALALEATQIVHGEEEAKKAKTASKRLFISVSDSFIASEATASVVSGDDSIPTTLMEGEAFIKGIPVFKLFEAASLCASGSEARRLVEQGGAYINNKKVARFDELIKPEHFQPGGVILLRAGKKKFHRIKLLDKR